MDPEMTASNPTDGSSDGIQKKQPGGRTCGPTRRSTKGQWTAEEDDILCKAVQRFKGKNWKKIAECFKDRTDVQCLHRWQKVLNPELVKGPWSKEEDEMIIELVNKFGAKKWSTIAQYLPGRIGKQCRERWHNHLNPAINKDAWTQEEELTLIRAHQIYGNRWAELTKFLTGRSDNAIKNHWNSSVKKKLDSYLASGLLDQCQGLPLVALQNKPMNPSLSRRQSSCDESGARGGAEAEESECSHGSALRSYSQSASDLPNEIEYANEHVQMSIMPCGMEDQSLIPTSCSETYFPSFEDVQFSIPEFPCEAEYASKFPDQNFSRDAETSTTLNCQLDQQDQHNFSSMEYATLCIPSKGSQEAMNGTSQTLVDERAPLFVANTDAGPQTPGQMLISDEECCRALFSEIANDEASGVLVQGLHGISSRENKAPLLCQSSDGFIYPDESCNSQGSIDRNCISDQPGHSYLLKDTLKLVPMKNYSSPRKVAPIFSSIDGKSAEQETGGLCYEPPRFPSMEVPFLSCDLVESNGDLQQEYSPLGIRQLMMSSANCLTPFRIWNSPSRDCSPDAMLKSAAKTFTGTPSILKKRQRSLFSPLSDRRKDKKLETDVASTLAKGFPRLDVMLDECKNNSSHPSQSPEQRNKSNGSSQATENQSHALDSVHQEDVKDIASVTNDKAPEETLDLRIPEGYGEEVASETNTMEKDRSDLVVQKTSGALVERENIDQKLFSPGKTDSKADKALIWSVKTPISLSKRLVATPKHGVSAVQSAPAGNTVDNAASNIGVDNHCIFGGTPFRRILESPSSWKSPLYFNSFLPSPKFDTEITIEDMGFFMSPGDKSYDALGLMKHLSKHTAAAYADALEVLGDDTPETILRKRQLSKLKQDKENHHEQVNQQANCSNTTAPVERRTLDFSDCGTPGKGKSSSAAASKGFSSPSSYLLKSCR